MKIERNVGNIASPLAHIVLWASAISTASPTEILYVSLLLVHSGCEDARLTVAAVGVPGSRCGDGAHDVECSQCSTVLYVETVLVRRNETDSAFVMLRLTHL